MADLSSSTFVNQFPEFREIADQEPEMVTAALATAAQVVGSDRWGALLQKATFLAAAHDLAMSPYGENLRLKGDPTASVYQVRLQQLARTRAPRAFGLAGGLPGGGW